VRAGQILSSGGLVAIPTETVYGLAGNALDPLAVAKIFEAKNRPFFDPLIVHIGDVSQLHQFTTSVSEKAEKLMAAFWPGPLTLLFNKSTLIPDIVTSGLEKVAIRMPNHPMTLKLLQSLSFPLAAPSANPFGYVSPTEAAHVESHLGQLVPMILDGGPCGVGVESTIVDVGTFPVTILRLGGITVEQIEECLNEKVDIQISSSKPSAPGMLESHYAPRKPMFWHGDTSLVNNDARTGFLSFEGNLRGDIVFELSSKGDLIEAAARLFQGMRWLDDQDIDRIEVMKLPELGLGRAMNDRLNRACRS
jgi:L-threonylcarbamoyladenylate synthase